MPEIIYLKPKSLFPSIIHSDTLMGAICYGISEIFGKEEVKEFIEKKEPSVLITSAFPFVEKNGEKVHFFPKLIVKPGRLSTDFLREMKKFKKASFMHEDIFNKWVNGDVSEGDLIKGMKDKYEVKSGILSPKNSGMDFNIRTIDRTHNLLNRLTSQSQEFFYTTNASFENAGLFFMIEYTDRSQKNKIESALRYLEDRGIGGDISSGSGQFELELGGECMIIHEPKNGKYFTTLSLYSPSNELDSFDESKMYYERLRREGKSRDGIMKKEITMFNHGSTFPAISKKYPGKVEYVRNDPPMIEWGFAYPVKVAEHEM